MRLLGAFPRSGTCSVFCYTCANNRSLTNTSITLACPLILCEVQHCVHARYTANKQVNRYCMLNTYYLHTLPSWQDCLLKLGPLG